MTHNNKSLKICLVTVTLSGGGAERCAATLSRFFVKNHIEVHNVVFSGEIVYDYAGQLLHLETLKDKSNSLWSRFKRFKALKSYIKTNDFDFIIDFRTKEYYWQEFIIHNFIYKNTIQTIHSHALSSYFPKNKFLSKILYFRALKLVTVSKDIEKKVMKKYHFKNTFQIYNPIDVQYIESNNEINNIDFNYILGIGSMNKNVKQFDHLIDCYSKSILPLNNIKLIILGDGKLKNEMILLTKTFGQEQNILFKGNVSNPFLYYKQALFTTLTSKYEGLPMVLLESLASETPVIAYDCDSGPREIILHNQNGLLVENQNKTAFINAMNIMIEDKHLYLHCKKNAKKSVESYDMNIIGNQWLQLFKDLSK